jgi:hypothetical protein
MPDDFTRCQRRGGKIRTIKPRADISIPICYPTDGGTPVHGEVHRVKNSDKKEGKE